MSALAAQLSAAPRLLARVEAVRPRFILAGLIVLECLTTLGVALSVRHNGWLYYQGGDELWHYTTAWVMGQGRLPHTSIGYAWSMVLLPFALLGGPNLMSPLPFIVLLNVLVLMPIALLAIYGIGNRIGGRLFGYWTALLWILVPLIGIKYADTGYHQAYTELLLPQGLGLTAMSDFPSMVAGAAAAYFTLRALQDDDLWSATLAGLLAGVALGIKPSNAPLVVGMGLALLWSRRWRPTAYVVAGLVPSIVALAVWKARGEGAIPLFRNGAAGTQHLVVAAAAPVLAFSLSLHKYVHPSWSFFAQQLDSIREHFWSVRVLEWVAIGGTIGLLRRSRPAGLLFGGWLFATLFVKWGSPGHGTVDDSDLLRQTISTIPAWLVVISGVVLLLPRLPQRLARPRVEALGDAQDARRSRGRNGHVLRNRPGLPCGRPSHAEELGHDFVLQADRRQPVDAVSSRLRLAPDRHAARTDGDRDVASSRPTRRHRRLPGAGRAREPADHLRRDQRRRAMPSERRHPRRDPRHAVCREVRRGIDLSDRSRRELDQRSDRGEHLRRRTARHDQASWLASPSSCSSRSARRCASSTFWSDNLEMTVE